MPRTPLSNVPAVCTPDTCPRSSPACAPTMAPFGSPPGVSTWHQSCRLHTCATYAAHTAHATRLNLLACGRAGVDFATPLLPRPLLSPPYPYKTHPLALGAQRPQGLNQTKIGMDFSYLFLPLLPPPQLSLVSYLEWNGETTPASPESAAVRHQHTAAVVALAPRQQREGAAVEAEGIHGANVSTSGKLACVRCMGARPHGCWDARHERCIS